MRFNLTIHADNLEEMRAALDSIANNIPARTFDRTSRGFRIEVSPEYHNDVAIKGDEMTPVREPVPAILTETVVTAPDAPADAAKRVRRTKAQIEADAKAKDEELPAAEIEAESEDNGVEMVPEEATPVPEEAPSNAAEAKLMALDLLRQAYAMQNGPVAVKTLQAELGVAKFVDVAEAEGDALLVRAKALVAGLIGGAK